MSLPVVLFVDGTAPKPYDPDTLATEGLGGTEATVIRVAEGLAATGMFQVYVETHNRVEPGKYGAWYVKPDTVFHADYVISLRYPQLTPLMQKRFKNARHFLWNHDLMTPNTAQDLVTQSGFEAIAVSNYHKIQMQTVLKPQGYDGQFPIKVVYNPIADDLQPDETPVDRNKLVWTSSPHKGLENALSLFSSLRRFNPDFRLYVANPGYLPDGIGAGSVGADGVVGLGPLAHSDVLNHLRTSLCLFYPNCVFPETFGLVLAEADAVGTPTLTHPIGAAPEVLFHPYSLVDCRDVKQVIDRVMSWYEGDRPRVKAKKEFRLSNVIKSWLGILHG